MKKALLLVLVLVLISSVGYAAPLTDYKAGKVAIDVTFFPSSTEANLTNNFGYHQAPSTEGTFDFGLTVGLGEGFALQYRQFNPQTQVYNNNLEQVRLSTQEFNLLKQILKNKDTQAALFAGFTRAQFTDYFWVMSSSSNERGLFQIGVTLDHKIAKNTSLFGKIGVGTDIVNSEVGVAYAFSKNFDFNVSYRYLNVSNFSFENSNPVRVGAAIKGLGVGVTAKF